MRQSDKEIKNLQNIEEILHSANEFRITFADQPHPYMIPVNHSYHKGNIYFPSATKRKKIDIIGSLFLLMTY